MPNKFHGVEKREYSCYISEELDEIVNYLIQREDTKRVIFVRKAINYFLASDRTVEPRVKNRKRNDPGYIKRGKLFVTYLEEEQKEQLKRVAEEQGCFLSQVFFQVLLNYCAVLISLDSTGLKGWEDI